MNLEESLRNFEDPYDADLPQYYRVFKTVWENCVWGEKVLGDQEDEVQYAIEDIT